MRIIALEEHIATPEIVEAWRKLDPVVSENSIVRS